jgi:hypothetical protein
MRKFTQKTLTGVMAVLLLLTLLAGCGGTKDGLDPKTPVTLTCGTSSAARPTHP